MLYGYSCEDCDVGLDYFFPIGKAPDRVDCPDCGDKRAKRLFCTSFDLSSGGFPSRDGKFNREMTERNERAGKRMRKEHTPPVKTVAHDYGNGDVREVKEK